MGTTLQQRATVCADESIAARVSHALLELGKKAVVADCVAAIVLASTVVGDKAVTVGKLLGESITDAEIILYVKALA